MNNKKDCLYKFEQVDSGGNKRNFAILKPNRKNKEDGELYYASKLSQFIAAGILPRIVWDKVYKDSGGIVSDLDKKQYSSLYVELANLRNDLDVLSSKNSNSRSAEDNDKISLIEGDIVRIRREMQDFEMEQINAFENTAEAKARNRTIIWWAANLGSEEVNGSFKSILEGDSIDEKLDFYDDQIENDEFLSSVFSRINYLVTVWYVGGASSEKEFKSLDDEYSVRLKVEKDSDELVKKESVKEIENKKEAVAAEVGQEVEKAEEKTEENKS